MIDPVVALERLRGDPAAVTRICVRFEVDLLTAFGSAAGPDPARPPNDLDVGARRLHGPLDVLGLLDALADFTGCDRIDLMDLARANPLARERALANAVTLYEAAPGLHTRAALAAMMERMDTAWLRELNLMTLAGRR